ncbi:MAG: hypothetical protein AB8B51_00595 [Sedimentitalea sp.]
MAKFRAKPDWSVLDMLTGFLSGAMVGLGVVFMLGATLTFCLVPIAYDTIHLQDTMFFAELGWRILNGALPTIDFNHFYGGVVAQYVAWAFQLFGVSVKSIDYAFVMMMLSTLGLAMIVAAWRTTRLSALALAMLVVACVLARVPFEELTAIQRPTSAHSFVYNRLGSAIALVLTVFALIPASKRWPDVIAGLLCGAAAYMIVLIKPTFVPFLPVFYLALLLQGRWIALAASAVGLGVAIVALDPGAARIIASFDYAVGSAGSRVSITDLILKTVAVFLVQPMPLLFVFLALVVAIKTGGRRAVMFTLAAFGLTVGFGGMTATMGWRGSIGQQALPFLSVICVVFYEWARKLERPNQSALGFLQLTAICVVMSFTLPQLAQSTLSGLVGYLRQPLVLFSEGPLSTYLAWSDEFITPKGQISEPMPLAEQIDAAKAHLEAGLKINVGVEYAMIADGVALLDQVPNVKNLGIGGDYGMFTFALGAVPVMGYPVWVSTTSPEFAPEQPLPENLGLMMIRRVNPNALSDQLLSKMEATFVPCASSKLWLLYVRASLDRTFCDSLNG